MMPTTVAIPLVLLPHDLIRSWSTSLKAFIRANACCGITDAVREHREDHLLPNSDSKTC